MLGEASDQFDYLWIQFYNNHCFFGGVHLLRDAGLLDQGGRARRSSWACPPHPTRAAATSTPTTWAAVTALVGRGAGSPQGIMLWDASYDRLNRAGSQTYGARVAALLGR